MRPFFLCPREDVQVLKKIGIAIVVLLLLAAAGVVALYQIEGRPLPEASGYLQGEGYTAATEADGALVFTPARPNGHGLLILHGALVEPLAYAKSAAYFAALGYTVYLPAGALRLPVNAVDAAAARMAGFGVADWVVIGHSMGGFAALELVRRHAPPVRALALWGSDLPADFRDLKLPLLFIRGERDGLLTPERFAAVQERLPPTVRYLTLPGGNHQGFALYSHQLFDNPGSTSADRQIDFADERSARFFTANLDRP